MQVRWMNVRTATALLAAVLSAGCQAAQSKSATNPAAAVAAAPSRLTYTPARQGLPSTRIWKSQMAFGDINKDGFPDIGVVSRLSDGPHIFAGDGKGNWLPADQGLPRETFCGGGMDFGDVNNDGNMDVAIADHCRGAFVFLGDSKGNWKPVPSGLPNVGNEDIALGDFNNDKCLDVALVATSDEGVRAFAGNCKGIWKESSEGLATKEWGNAVTFADVDGDGKQDIIAAYSAGPRVWVGNGKGHWTEASEGLPAPEIHGLYWGVATGDVNGDGLLDVASGAAIPGTEVFLQEKGETGPKWRKATEGLVPMNTLGVALGDIDKDGHLDLVAVGKTNLDEIGGVYGVFPFLGDGKGNWTLASNTGLPETGRERTWGVGLADIDNDGVLDVAAAFGDVLAPTWRSGPKAKGPKPGANFRKGWKDLKEGMTADEVAKTLEIDPPVHSFWRGLTQGEYTLEPFSQYVLTFDANAFGSDRLAKFQGPETARPPERGMFGAIEVWRGSVHSK